MPRRTVKSSVSSAFAACLLYTSVNIDGECEYVNDVVFELVPKGIKFVVPQFSEFHKGRNCLLYTSRCV